MKTRYKITIIIAIIAVAIPGIIIFGGILMMITANTYSGFIISSTPDESFEEDFAKIPEVKFFIEKYPNYTTNHSSDFLGWKIINYSANGGDNVVHLSVKKSVLHQGVKVSAACEIGGSSSYGFTILDDKVMDYLKNDSCLEKFLPACTSTRDACQVPPICKNAIWECASLEMNDESTYMLSEKSLQRVLNHCESQRKLATGETPARNPDGSYNVVDLIGLYYSNDTHYIDNNTCEWQYIGPATNSINKWAGAPIYKQENEN